MRTVTSSRSSALIQRGVRSSSHNARSPVPESTATNPACLAGIVWPVDRLGRQRQLVAGVRKRWSATTDRVRAKSIRRATRTCTVGSPSPTGQVTATTRCTSIAVRHSSRVIDSSSVTLLATATAVASRRTALSRAANARSAVMSRTVPTYTSWSVPPSLTALMAHHHPREVAVSMPNRCLVFGAAAAAKWGLFCSRSFHRPATGGASGTVSPRSDSRVVR